MLVYFLGPEASYTHQAALKYSLSAPKKASPSIPAVFSAVHASPEKTVGIIPIENSTNGPVAASLDLLAFPPATNPLRIIAEIRLPVRHCLLAHAPSSDAPPPNFRQGARPDLSALTSIHTHPQAWGQCTAFLSHYTLTPPSAPRPSSETPAGATCRDASSTSAAAALAAADSTGRTAAISSSLAAEATGASVLLEGLEDSDGNVTRFFVLASSTPADADTDTSGANAVRKKALVTFQLAPGASGAHDKPGSLSAALGVFSAHGLNLTSINTRPRGGVVPFEYCFIVEVELGCVSGNGELGSAVRELEGVVGTGECKVRGVWSVEGVES